MEAKNQDDRDEADGSAMGHKIVTGNELQGMEASISDRASGSTRHHHNSSLAYHHDYTLAEHAVSTVEIPDTPARSIHPTSEQAFTVTLPPSLTQNRNASSILSPNQAQSITETALLSSPSSHLRYKGLEGDLAEVLSDFLSKAKAKRAANFAAQGLEGDSTLVSKDDDEVCKPSTDLLARSRGPGTPSRRALDILDKNTPSPALSPSRYPRTMAASRPKTAVSKRKVAVLKVKASAANEEAGAINMDEAEAIEENEHEDEATNIHEEKEVDEDKEAAEQVEQTASATPSRRKTRSGKKRSPPRVRTINLRRPTGNEFVFQPRTEAQELALKTRANTRKNKGKAKSVQAFLKEQEEQKKGESAENDENQKDKSSDNVEKDEPVTPEPKRPGKKNVHFDDDNLVNFFEEPEQKFLSLGDIPTPTRRSKRRAAAPPAEGSTATTEGDDDGERAPLPLFSPSVTRKVRRLGPAKRKRGVLTGSGATKAKKVKVEG